MIIVGFDKFILTGNDNQTFVGDATLKTGAYKDDTEESKEWYLDPETLRIDLEDVVIFPEPKPGRAFDYRCNVNETT